MTDHDRARELAATAVDFDLVPDDRWFLDAHLVACDDCRAYAEKIGLDAAAITALPQVAAPDGLRERVLDPEAAPRVLDSQAASPPPAPPARDHRTPPRSLFPVPERYRPAAVVAAVVAVSLVAGTLAWQLSPRDPGVAIASPTAPGSSPGASAATPPPDDRLAIAALEPTAASGGVVELDAGFRLSSLDGTPAAELATHLVVDPHVTFEIAPEPDGAVRLTPVEPLLPGAVYRFSLEGESGQLLDSWAFQTRAGVRVVGTLPGDESTDVPIDTGIEVTFDQDGVTDAADHFSIAPAVEGRFEQHGRVLAFIPKALQPATAYTVTISAGVTVGGTDEVSTESVTFRFETSSSTAQVTGRLLLQDDLVEVAAADRATIGMWIFREDDAYAVPAEARVEVFRLPTIEAATEAFQELRTWSWVRHAATGLTSTDGLARVLNADLPVQQHDAAAWVVLPDVLPAGWYLVQIPTPARPLQAILQVTNLAAYVAISDTRTVIWANDLASDGPVPNAVVSADGAELGRTGGDGLLLAETPARLLPAGRQDCQVDCEPVISIVAADGRAALVPTTGQVVHDGFFDPYFFYGESASSRYWTVFTTDRTLFRPTDTINAWGVLRERDSGTVPATVIVRLVPELEAQAGTVPPVAEIELEPSQAGAFAGSIKTTDLPVGAYRVQLIADGDTVSETSIRVGQILKPAYRLEVETGRRVYLAGDRIRVTMRAAFYDGSPVPGVPIRLDGYLEDEVATDDGGTAIIPTTARADEDPSGGPSYQVLYGTPGRPEEGEIAGASRDFIVFPSSRTIAATAEIRDGRVRVNGDVHLVDQERLEREIGDGGSIWDLDPRGNPVNGARVSVRFVERVLVRGEGRQEYDFLQKKVVTVYDYFVEEREVGTATATTSSSGAFSASIPAGDGDHDYDVYLSVKDADGHTARAIAYASRIAWTDESIEFANLNPTDPALADGHEYAVGESVDLTFHAPDSDEADRGFLFFEAQRGIQSAVAQASPRFVMPFEASSAPGTDIYGVRFNGVGYDVGSSYHARFRVADRTLDIQLTTTSDSHAPGDKVTVDVLVRDAAGAPAAATVILRAVDEKLYTIGGSEEVDALGRLYASVGSGVRLTYATHRTPRTDTGGGDTTGGGGDDRSDFRDSLLFTTIETGSDGRGSVTFDLSDDLTSWRVSGSAITTDLEAGDGTLQIPVGLPFFVDATIAPEYLTGDQPTILVRTFGTGVDAGDDVSITVEAPSLGLSTGPLAGSAFESVAVPLPALRPGRHEITVRATTGSGSSAQSDGVTRTFLVVESRLSKATSAFTEVGPTTRLDGGAGLTTVVVSDLGAGRHLPLLMDLAGSGSGRLDSSLASAIAASLLADEYGLGPDHVPSNDFSGDPYQTQDGGLALLPFASSSIELSAMVAMAGPDRFDVSHLELYLANAASDDERTREERIVALAGLAALGSPVLPELQAAAADPELTIRERLWVGMGAARIGDATTARAILADLIEAYGEQSADGIRLRVGESTTDIATATALAAVLAASIGDARAPQLWMYVEANPSAEAVFDLHAAAYVVATLEWLERDPARFAWSLDGDRTEVDLGPGQAYAFAVTADQLAGLRIEGLQGAIGVTTSWREPVQADAFEPDPDVSISRSVTPEDRVDSEDLVRVDLTVTFKAQAPTGCHQVTDLVPSGLVPVGNIAAWIDPDTEEPLPDVGLPYFQGNQVVRFCAEPTDRDRTVELRYYARVITPGTYVWQPAVVDSRSDPSRASVTPATQVVIR